MEIQVSVTAGEAKGAVFSFEQPDCFLFGRSQDAKVSLANDGFVSRQHFLLTIAPPECRVTDLGSKNGTIVNGRRYGGRKPAGPGVAQAPDGQVAVTLKHGDEIVVGDTRMSVAINADAVCMQCRSAIHHRDKPACEVPGGFRCAACRARPLAAETLSKIYSLQCIRCGSDVTAEAGNGGQVVGAEFVCGRCRERALAPVPSTHVSSTLAPPVGAPAIPGYTVLAELGRGGMGAVYKARHDPSGALVAIKTMLPHVAINAGHVQMFEREVQVTHQLRHPNIVELRGYGKVDGTVYCVLEFVDGVDLAKLIQRRGGKLQLQEAGSLMLQILDGLGHAHTTTLSVELPGVGARTVAGIVHRDLKPQNILLAADAEGWKPKVADFGLSKAFESAGMSSFTSEGQVAGTPLYWPREQITQYRYLHPATDVFSIAAVFYEALTGSPIRDSFAEMTRRCEQRGTPPNLGDFAIAILDGPIVPIQRRHASIPPAVAAVLDRALAEAEVPRDPAQMRDMLSRLRYPDALSFRRALAAALGR